MNTSSESAGFGVDRTGNWSKSVRPILFRTPSPLDWCSAHLEHVRLGTSSTRCLNSKILSQKVRLEIEAPFTSKSKSPCSEGIQDPR